MAKGLSQILSQGGMQYVRRLAFVHGASPFFSLALTLTPHSLARSPPVQRAGHSQYNGVYDFRCQVMRQNAEMRFTSVSGHLMEIDFVQSHKKWNSCNPLELFTAPVVKRVRADMNGIERTLQEEARNADWLVLWLDCDREGENIAFEVVEVCLGVNRRLKVLRARFSALIPADILRAVQTLAAPDRNMSEAVEARQEIDLRLGAAFTRFQTLRLQPQFNQIKTVVSYGPCQFPTLGFVVERWNRIQSFVPEDFWGIALEYSAPCPAAPGGAVGEQGAPRGGGRGAAPGTGTVARFAWKRVRLYDRWTVATLLQLVHSGGVRHTKNVPRVVAHIYLSRLVARPCDPLLAGSCARAVRRAVGRVCWSVQPSRGGLPSLPPVSFLRPYTQVATAIKVRSAPSDKWRPLPLATVELQKCASRYLRISSKETMDIAEALYQRGLLSYPRTETDSFQEGFDLSSLIDEQRADSRWGAFAAQLQDNGGFLWPRAGQSNDNAHPPIHPVKAAPPGSLHGREEQLYNFIARRFLACCSRNAKGQKTSVEATMGGEHFTASGLMVIARNYLDVYPWDKWHGSKIPVFVAGETFTPTSLKVRVFHLFLFFFFLLLCGAFVVVVPLFRSLARSFRWLTPFTRTRVASM